MDDAATTDAQLRMHTRTQNTECPAAASLPENPRPISRPGHETFLTNPNVPKEIFRASARESDDSRVRGTRIVARHGVVVAALLCRRPAGVCIFNWKRRLRRLVLVIFVSVCLSVCARNHAEAIPDHHPE